MTAKPLAGVSVFAPAKVNLTLHVTGQREDGYHLLDSLVAFGTIGDWVTMGAGKGLTLSLEGGEAGSLSTDPDNLVLQAARLLDQTDVAFRLQKNLPIASGIGGGSADAAAAYRGILARDGRLNAELFAAEDGTMNAFAQDILQLGADVPMCLLSKSARVMGIGEKLSFVDLPKLPVVLVNPRVQVSTPAVFGLLPGKDHPAMPADLPDFVDVDAVINWLAGMRNDLEAPAMALCPTIADVLTTLRDEVGCGLARMSGSGATCFGLFHSAEDANAAAERLNTKHPEWWVAGGFLGDQLAAATPRFS